MSVPKYTEELLEDLAASLQVPASRFKAAERSYKSVGEWLQREESLVGRYNPNVYIQGSFRLGTVIRPESDAEDYDVDLVCELSLSKTLVTQARLKAMVGSELQAYAKAHGMKAPEEGRRCWTLDYADGAQFHLDALPAVPDAAHQRLFLEQRGYSAEWTDTAIAITDSEDSGFWTVTNNWPGSNPKGYSNWFHARMREVFEARRRAMAIEARASIEDIPEYEVRTPLQSAIQILKRHRDVMFQDRTDDKPISIVVTTLAAHAYKQEPSISGALYSILARMDEYIEKRNGVAWISNPTDPTENFADRWQEFPERERAFFKWLYQARADFAAAADASSRSMAAAALEHRLGSTLMAAASGRSRVSALAHSVRGARRIGKVLNPAHRRAPPWNSVDYGSVKIDGAMVSRSGFRPERVGSDGRALAKQCSLRFEANTNVPRPFKVYWQVVNTGREAEAANCLRGGFDEGIVSRGKLKRSESTLYRGTHSIECLIVKQGYLAARSGQFIVNIQ